MGDWMESALSPVECVFAQVLMKKTRKEAEMIIREQTTEAADWYMRRIEEYANQKHSSVNNPCGVTHSVNSWKSHNRTNEQQMKERKIK